MRRRSRWVPGVFLLLGAVGASLLARGAEAQESRGFLFGKPNATLSLNMGYGIPSAGSDIFQEIDTLLTLGKADFRSPVLGGSISIFMDDRLDLAFDVSYSGSESWSEYVDWTELVGGQEVPIEQKTKFYRVPLTASVRYYFMDRGREISRFAWVPTTWSPYAGIGAGRVWYKFKQEGDFVDFVDNSIFYYEYESSGGAWMGHAFAGAQFSASDNIVLTAEGRYSWADAELDRNSFTGYEPIDLSGFQVTVGVGLRF